MAGEQVHLREVLAHHVVDGAGQLAFSAEAPVFRTVVVIAGVVHHENVVIVHVPVPLPGLHDQAVFREAVGILLGEGGEHVRVLLHHADLVAEGLVAAQQGFEVFFLPPAADDPVNRHLVRQATHQLFRLLRQCEQLIGRGVEFCHTCREGGGEHIDHHGDGQHNGRRGHAVAAGPERPGGEGIRHPLPAEIGLFHSLHLRFSRDCTLKNRKNPVTDR